MKKITFLALLLITSLGAFSQNLLYLENGTSCGLWVGLYAQDPSNSCDMNYKQAFWVGSGASVPAIAPTGLEWTSAYIQGDNGCTFSERIDTDGFPACVTCPGFGVFPTITSASTGGCNGCPSTITMEWNAYCSSGPGHIHFY